MTFESVKDIQSFISAMIATKIDAGQVVNMHWAVTDVLNEYSDIEGGDVDFYLITARQYVFEQVKKCVKKYEPNPDGINEQLVLDGFVHLQKAYPVKRGGVRELVPVELLSNEELELRASEYDAMADGCRAHAKEIRAYASSRQAIA